ncbi:hypothetical protein EDD29_0087 [Actinocorallia herbida]|uniref:Uncharacterized protein n=1 Tax=Actinocorallia herbida TaxID=58109 RepID=A0A3N1CMQ5_9ACTN|nr:hypothetical protein [Actinocorallia herbida]ROO82606.1 hypothetical protein EDD29_0087 [Actinocorallia herbida]
MDEDKNLYLEFATELLSVLAEIAHMLRWHLPIAIGIPGYEPGAFKARPASNLTTAIRHVERARHLLKEEPLTERHRDMFNDMLLSWLSGAEITDGIGQHGATSWRVDSVDALIDTVEGYIELIAGTFPCTEPPQGAV